MFLQNLGVDLNKFPALGSTSNNNKKRPKSYASTVQESLGNTTNFKDFPTLTNNNVDSEIWHGYPEDSIGMFIQYRSLFLFV